MIAVFLSPQPQALAGPFRLYHQGLCRKYRECRKVPFLLAVQARMKRFSDPRGASLFKAYPAAVRARLMALRELVLDTAARTAGVGALTETLKWGQPSYLTKETGSGTTVRIDRLKAGDGYAIYFHCQSGLVGQFRELYPDTFRYDGQRAMQFAAKDRLPVRELRHCIALALTHHLRKKAKRGG